ncbi:hypothetical protein DOZ91_23985 [Peribacillus frigoritolerans]|nr:hypothetical protein DOZ91_23985 [Peribacillus frigoritolerans]
MERKVRDSCGKSVARETHRRKERRGGSPTARGKRVPGGEINAQILQPLKKKVPADFRNPLPFRRLLAEPSRRKRLWGLG